MAKYSWRKNPCDAYSLNVARTSRPDEANPRLRSLLPKQATWTSSIMSLLTPKAEIFHASATCEIAWVKLGRAGLTTSASLLLTVASSGC
eukprot:5853885-Amphidinium_carterae.2